MNWTLVSSSFESENHFCFFARQSYNRQLVLAGSIQYEGLIFTQRMIIAIWSWYANSNDFATVLPMITSSRKYQVLEENNLNGL